MKKEKVVDVFPMTDIQKGMVALSMKNPEAAIYRDQFVYLVPPIYRKDDFVTALRLMIEKHPVLRTGFDLVNYSEEVQIVYDDVEPLIEFIDLVSLNQEEQEQHILEYMDKERARVYDFNTPPIWRMAVFFINDDFSVYMIQFHHAMMDGWSLASLNTQLFNAYYQLQDNKDYKPEPLKTSFKDIVIEEVAEKNNSESINYWKAKLKEFTRLDIFSMDKPCNDFGRIPMGMERSMLMREQSSRNMLDHKSVAFAAVAYVLNMLTRENDFVVGIVSNTRPAIEDSDKVIGCFLNTLPLRLQFDKAESMTWLEYFRTFENELIELKTKDRSTLRDIAKIAGQREGGENPFFDVFLNCVDFHNVYKDLQVAQSQFKLNTTFKKKNFEISNTYFDITFHNFPSGEFEIEYKLMRELKAGISVRKFHELFLRVLDYYLSDPGARIQDSSLLPEEDSVLLAAFNATGRPYAHNVTVLDLLGETVQQHSNRPAVSFKEETLTYGELNERSNRLANYLIKNHGIQPGDLVGISLERSERMILSILGVLKSGGAYIPMDTNYPGERLAYIKADSGCKVCIDEDFLKNFDKEKGNYKTQVEGVVVSGSNTAYAIYTSGSTGNPKGVLNEHAGLYNRLLWMRDDLGINASDVILQKTPFTFDVSVWELLMPSITGCKLVFAEPEGHKDPVYLQNIIESAGITIMHFVPSMLGVFLEELEPGKCKTLRHLVCSGEALPAAMVEEVKQKLPWVRIHNLYGPTEAAIDVTSIDLTEVDTKEHGVTIGKPVANTKIYIVDKNMALQPVGIPGELLIEGVQVARGYLNRPELTAEKFIESPFNKGERAYRTGDLAKWLPNGEIEYIGRIDNQVKIRGNRIELGEIEARIKESGYAEQAAVLAIGDTLRKYLVAYVVPGPGYSEEVLFNWLSAQLPEYMLPSRVIELAEFPLTSSGKLNRKMLPVPSDEGIAHTAYEAPRNETEMALAGIWKEVLGVKQPGIHDNFFRVGGDSILAIRLISRINKKFNTALTIAGLYGYNTIARLSDFISNVSAVSAEEEMVRKNIMDSVDQLKQAVLRSSTDKENIADIYPMMDIQKGMILLSSINPIAGTYHDQFVYQVPSVNVELFNRAFAKLVEKHEALRTCFDLTTHEQEVQIVQKKIKFNIIQTDLQFLEKEQQEKFIADFMVKEREVPFDPRVAPLWRVNLFATSPNNAALLFQFHHAILDGWSVASLNTELFQIYRELAADPDYRPALLKSSNKQAAIEELIEKSRHPNVEPWKNELADYQRLNIFIKNKTYKTYVKRYALAFRHDLLKRCEEDKVNLKYVVYGAFVYIIKMISIENDFVIGSVSNNRPIAEDGDKVLGCFLNTTPVRNRLEDIDNMSWVQYFKKIEDKFISLKDMERTTLYQIAKIANENDTDNSPFFDIIYNYIDFHIYNSLGLYNGDTAQKNNAGRLSVANYESTNTALDLIVNVTGDMLAFSYTLIRDFKMDISLEKFHEFVDKVLTTYIHSPHAKTKEMEVVSEEEKQKLLYDFNDSYKNHPVHTTVIDLFSEQVIKAPEHRAIAYEGRNITYKELDKLSDQFAHFLVSQGISKGELVLVYLLRSPEIIISILGILKAGAVYLPIDTGNPPERINYMLKDSAARFVLTGTEFVNLFDANIVTPICIDTIDYQGFPEGKTGVVAGTEDIAYIIYTSGSTGKPKGVVVNHGALASRLYFYKNYYNLGEEHRILNYNSFGFDACIEEYLLPLATGAECIIAGSVFKDNLFANMVDFIEEYKITRVTMPPVVLQDFLDALPNNQVDRIRSLRQVVAGGDKINVEIINNFYSKIGIPNRISLYNAYGPTENTIDSSIFRLDGYPAEKNIPIGKPVDNSGIYILDSNNRLMPIGLTGEICVSGSGLAIGYLNQPERTAEKFVPHPFKEGERMYRTGDTGYWLPDGNVVFVGRIDNQVKLRGYRIELGEIEATILQSGLIENAAVLIKQESETRKYLVAYIMPREGYRQADLYSYLKEQLPDYMVPGMIIEMEKFPVNINGKLDVKALLQLGERSEIAKEYVAPTNPTEEKLVAIWQQLLKINQVGIKDNFFEVGGDSLIILKLRQKIMQELDIQVNVVDLFSHTTIQDFAAYISQDKTVVAETGQDTKLETLKF